MELSQKVRELLDSKKLTIYDVHASLKIPKKFLQALIDGDYTSFPPKVYALGYLKEIAGFLNVDESEIVALYQHENIQETNNIKYEPILEIDKKPSNLGTFLILVVFAALVIGVLYLFVKEKPVKNTLKNNNKVNETILQNKEDSKIKKSSNVTRDNSSDFKATEIDNETSHKDNKTAEDIIKNVRKQLDNFTIVKEQPIRLLATEKVWVRVTTDNKTKRTFILSKGDNRTVSAKKFFKLDIGNAGGLKLFVKGKEYYPLGEKGEVKHITIYLDNISLNR